jgi:hypothetical protein
MNFRMGQKVRRKSTGKTYIVNRIEKSDLGGENYYLRSENGDRVWGNYYTFFLASAIEPAETLSQFIRRDVSAAFRSLITSRALSEEFSEIRDTFPLPVPSLTNQRLEADKYALEAMADAGRFSGEK